MIYINALSIVYMGHYERQYERQYHEYGKIVVSGCLNVFVLGLKNYLYVV